MARRIKYHIYFDKTVYTIEELLFFLGKAAPFIGNSSALKLYYSNANGFTL
jgi:hypothetical protein